MTSYTVDTEKFKAFKGKTILIIGAVSGIGREALRLIHENGANVGFGDYDEVRGTKIAEELGSQVLFRKCDISKFDDVLELFQATWKRFGTIHSVLSNAGVNKHEGLLDDHIDEKTGKLLPPDLGSIDTNLIGHTYVVKCAIHYFKKWPETQCQIVMTASAASFFPAPPIHMYCAAKTGMLGLMRALRYDPARKNATINLVAPWMTETPMMRDDWKATWGDLPLNSAEGAAKTLLLPLIQPELNGKSFFVAGNEITEFEDTLLSTQPQWMGQQLSDWVNQGQVFLLGARFD